MPERLGDRLEQLDKEIRAWANVTRKQLLFRLNTLNLKERQRLANELALRESLRSRLRKKSGDLEAVSFAFARHGIFLERGVGRGRPAGSAKAEANAKQWIKPILDPAVVALAELIENEFADIVQADLRFFIPGIIDINTANSN